MARAVVGALCAAALNHHERVTLVVRSGNRAALRAYDALGFQPWYEHRMPRIAYLARHRSARPSST
ncbi:MAG: hypothetical protein V1772_13340 [Chloroflexota bacterium]